MNRLDSIHSLSLFLTVLVVLAMIAGACGGQATATPTTATAQAAATPTTAAAAQATTAPATAATAQPALKQVNIAFFAAQPTNYGVAQTDGINEIVAANQNVAMTKYVAEGDPQKQSTQMQDALATGKFNAFLVTPVSAAILTPIVQDAIKAGVKVVDLGTPLGPDATTVEPQIAGMVGAVLRPASDEGADAAALVIKYCAQKDPCNVAYIMGSRALDWDVARFKGFSDALSGQKNIRIVAQGEGAFVRASTMKVAADMIQAQRDLSVIVTCCDQGALGSYQAVQDAGLVGKIAIVGGGASKDGVDAVKAGQLLGSTVLLPKSGAKVGTQMIIKAVRGEKIDKAGINEKDLSPVGGIVTPDNVSKFTPEWQG